MTKLRFSLTLGIVILVAVFGVKFFTTETVSNVERWIFPETLAGLSLQQPIIIGAEAEEQISRLHGTNISMSGGYIAEYAGGLGQVTVWLSTAETVEGAEELLKIMNEKMPQSTMFSDYQQFEVKGQIYHSVNGMGMAHYYYAKDNAVVWIAVNGANPMVILQEFNKALFPPKA